MRTSDDPLHPANVRAKAANQRLHKRYGVAYWEKFRRAGEAANAPIALLRYAEDAHDAAFIAGVEYAKKAIAKGAKP